MTDDFIRNFLIRYKLNKTLDAFQQEWYEMIETAKIDPASIDNIPDIYI